MTGTGKAVLAGGMLFALAAGAVIRRGFGGGGHAGHGAGAAGAAAEGAPAAGAPKMVWTCSMHPQIRQDAPGSCPICGMDLTPASMDEGGPAVRLGEGGRRAAGIEIATVGRRVLERQVRTAGRVEAAEPRTAHVSARVAGRIERLFVDYEGGVVEEGAPLLDLYSPDLVVAQEEMLAAARAARRAGEGSPERSALDASRRRLLRWGISADQIDAILSGGSASETLQIRSPIRGTVIEKRVRAGDYVMEGGVLYVVADLSAVWVQADVLERDLPWVAVGQEVALEVAALPGEPFAGTVSFVGPVVVEATRSIRVRVEVPNGAGLLKPGMYAVARIRARLGPDGKRASVGGEARRFWECPMHCQPPTEAPGRCTVCNMALVERVYDATAPEVIAVPAEAVLSTGLRDVVYREIEPGRYEAVAVTLGPRAGEFFPVVAGIAEGDRVVARGNFLLDSQAQIEGKPCLLFPEGLR